MNLVIFDIDGTLTRTNAGDEHCYAQTIREVFGISDISTNWFDYKHSTDSGITDEIVFKHKGRSPTQPELQEFQTRFVENLNRFYEERPGSFDRVPGASKVFDNIQETLPNWRIGISTGAFKVSAQMKLQKAGLKREDIPSSYADEHFSRDDIIRATIAKSQAAFEMPQFEKIVYVGDGRWDFASSKRLGIGFVGIADDRKPEYLKEMGATHIIPHYEDFQTFMDALFETPILKA